MVSSMDVHKGPTCHVSASEADDEAQLLVAEESKEEVLVAVRSAKRAVTVAAIISVLALAGAACVVMTRGAAPAEKAADAGQDQLVQLYGHEVAARLSSIESTHADAEAKLEAGVATIADQLFQDSKDLSRPERISKGERMSKSFQDKLDSVSAEGNASDPEVARKKMKVQMEALQEAKERIREMTKKFSAFSKPQLSKDQHPEWDCTVKLNSSSTAGDIMGYTSACASSGGWYRVYIDTIMREGEGFDTPQVHVLPVGTLVHVVEIRGRRARIDLVGNHPEDAVPMPGWVSQETANKVVILRPSRSAALFYHLRGQNSTLLGTVYNNAKLLEARKAFQERFKTTAQATKLQQDLTSKLRSIDTNRLAAGLQKMSAHREKTEKDIVSGVKQTVQGTEKVLQKDADKVVHALDDAPATQKVVKAGAKALESEVVQEVHHDLNPDKILSSDGKDLMNELGVSLGR